VQNGLSDSLIQDCLEGYREATLKNYNFAWKVWTQFLFEEKGNVQEIISVETTEKCFIACLQWMLRKERFSAALFLLVRSALSALFRLVFSGKEFGTLFQARLMSRNIRKEKPRMAKHKQVFDITLLLDQYRKMGKNKDLSDVLLREKVVTMLTLYIILRPIDMLRMDLSGMLEVEGGFHFSAVLKNTPEYSECVLARVAETTICPVNAFLELWNRVKTHVHGNALKGLFFCDDYTQPLNKYFLEREMRHLMFLAGIAKEYTPYSIKHAAMTFLIASGVSENIVNRNARLSQNAHTAIKHYFIGEACKIASQTIATAVSRSSSFLISAHEDEGSDFSI
jgi:hypothetical protein